MDIDVIIVGGSFAGLSAALLLANSRHNVFLIDAGNPSNAAAKGMHNFLGNEGTPPLVFLADARDQLRKFKNLTILTDIVTKITKRKDQFQVNTATDMFHAKRILLATGVRHVLPDIKNVSAFWVHNIFHCPYCFGPEVVNQPLAIYSPNEKLLEQVLLIRNWSTNLIVVTDHNYHLKKYEAAFLQSLSIPVYEDAITHFSGDPGQQLLIHFDDGKIVSVRGIFIHPEIKQQADDLIKNLKIRCNKDSLIKIGDRYQTTMQGVFAAGDAINKLQKVPTAIATGSLAAYYVDQDLKMEI